ncbi:hypothetical protein pdam_00017515 [Pocillopora damicornis]|uniref:Uncharacterized protein n=1 Tax=Pocillopora damicornis TaxID=46731 RepID=A0A3M6TCQ2_POCDA|nr:hypothetical protein pdam_00017515 [Pocillopora damicornis]
MQEEIKAGLYRCLKIPNQERHKYCPINSWCKFKKRWCKSKQATSLGYTPHQMLAWIHQNANESIIELAWNKCPKHKWYGRKRIVMAVSSAALHFS